jgi:hypothetical protein
MHVLLVPHAASRKHAPLGWWTVQVCGDDVRVESGVLRGVVLPSIQLIELSSISEDGVEYKVERRTQDSCEAWCSF